MKNVQRNLCLHGAKQKGGENPVNRINLSGVKQEPLQNHSSKGDQPKWQLNNKWYKIDYMGYESLSEVVVSGLLKKSNTAEFVLYRPVQIVYEGNLFNGCESENFRGENEMLIPFERLHRASKGAGLAQALTQWETPEEKIKYTVDFIENTTGLTNAGQYLTMLLELDAFFLNEDRHTNNLAVIRNEKTLQFRFCPIFDNGLSLLSDLNDYPLGSNLYDCIDRVKAKPFHIDFIEQVFAAESLYGSQLRFHFTRRDVTALLSDMTDVYENEILSRVEKILFEQMRKYSIYFKKIE